MTGEASFEDFAILASRDSVKMTSPKAGWQSVLSSLLKMKMYYLTWVRRFCDNQSSVEVV